MRVKLVALFLLSALVVASVATSANARTGRRDDVAVIVVLHRGADAEAVASQHGTRVGMRYRHALDGFSASIDPAKVSDLRRDPRVRFVEFDAEVTVYEQAIPTGIDRAGVTANPNLDIDGVYGAQVNVDIAVIDTGVDQSHPDLHVVGATNCVRFRPRSQGCRDGSAPDRNGHGTHVAGTAAAIDNPSGVVGVAPGARIHAVKVLTARGSGLTSWIIAGIDWVTANAAVIEVANMSLGGAGASPAMDEAISASVAAGVTYVVAAGNDASDAGGYFPAAHPDVITVSALADFDGKPGALAAPTCRADEDDTLAAFSNFGAVVDIVAPGVCILSTLPGGAYGVFSGTSMASPHVAGAAGILAAIHPQWSPADIKAVLLAEAVQDWTDDSGDGISEPNLNVSDPTVFGPFTQP